MQVFEPFNIQHKLISNEQSSSPELSTTVDFDDPDAMYAAWIEPFININEHEFNKKECVQELDDIFEIFLDLKKEPFKITKLQLLKEISIQISVYEALVFRHMFLNKSTNEWTLRHSGLNKRKQFNFNDKQNKTSIIIQNNDLSITMNNNPIGHLKIDMEHIILEKLHGTLFDKKFILDPIWLKKQSKVDAVKIQIDQYKTEIVHKPVHKDTLWTNGKNATLMRVSKNQSLNLHKKLLINVKKIHWKGFTLHSMQWYTPWFRFPIQGKYKLTSDKSIKF